MRIATKVLRQHERPLTLTTHLPTMTCGWESGIRSRVKQQLPDIVKFLVQDAGIVAIYENAVRPCRRQPDGRSAAEAWPWSIAPADAVCVWRMAVSPQDAEVDSGRRAVPVLPGPGRSLVGCQPVEQCGLDSTDAMHHRH